MSYLFCDSDGEDKVQEAIKTQGKYEGEFTKIVVGPLTTDGSRCDKCNKPLDKGDIGYYVAHLSETHTDPKGETQFFNMKNTNTYKY